MDDFEASAPVQAIGEVTFVECARVVARELERQSARLEAVGAGAPLFREWMSELRETVADLALQL